MSASEALAIIAAIAGRSSRTYLTACKHAADGRHADIVSAAIKLQPVRRGRNLTIAA